MPMESAIAVRVPKQKGEQIRQRLLKQNLLRKDLKIKKNEEYVFFPIKKHNAVLQRLFTMQKMRFEKSRQQISSYKELVSIPDELSEFLPTSFDIIGDILVVKIPKELKEYQAMIGNSLLKSQKQIHTVCAIEPVGGKFRTRTVSVIAGEKKTGTEHVEFGLRMIVDIQNTYFSPRLARERKRIAALVSFGEIVFDMFTGVAPFPLMIAKYAHPKKIIGIDINKKAVDLAQKNIMRNHVSDIVCIYHEDANNSLDFLNELCVNPDRIIMNLPFDSFALFPVALSIIKDKATIHYYEIIKESAIEKRMELLKETAIKHSVHLSSMLLHKIKTYAPHEFYIGIDITAKRKPADVA